MKIPDGAFPQMLKMVTQSLPYEKPFEPITPEARATVYILTAVTDKDPNLKDVEGFIYHLATKIDKSPKKQTSTRGLLLTLKCILDTYVIDTIPPTYIGDTTHEIE